MAFRRHEIRPTAQVVIQANDHVQLDKMLMALQTAILSYEAQPEREEARIHGFEDIGTKL